MKRNIKFGIGMFLAAMLLMNMALVPEAVGQQTAEKNRIGIDVSVPKPLSLPFDPNSPPPMERDDGMLIENTKNFLGNWNEKMGWGLSEKQITHYSKELEKGVLPKYYDADGKYYSIKNIDEFAEELVNVIGISNDQALAYVNEHRKEMVKDHQKYHKPVQVSDISIQHTVSPSSQSAPYAHKKLYYLYVFTNFQVKSADGDWTSAHNSDAQTDAYYGTTAIKDQADSRAGVVNDGGTYTVTVSGENTGGNTNAWGVNGWMEQAARNLGYSDSNGDGRSTDDMARSIKSWSGADNVVILYLTHDDKGAYAIGPDQSYADRGAISYWGVGSSGRFNSVPGSYEHEALHLYGALDEYSGASSCGATSIFAVSPMHDKYTNTNHVTCSSSTNSVMRDPYTTSTISLSSKRFIGWGDYDSDGILDPSDSTPWG